MKKWSIWGIKIEAVTEVLAESEKSVDNYGKNLKVYRREDRETSSSLRRNPEMDRQARARVLARRKKRRRNRRILFGFFVLLLLLVLGGMGYGISSYQSTKEKAAILAGGITLLDQGDYEGAITAIDKMIQYSGGNVGKKEKEGLQYRAEAEYQLKDYEAALHTYELLMEHDKEKEEYQRMASLCRMELGDYEAALSYEPLRARVYNRMALDHMEKEEYDKALDAITLGKAQQDLSMMADLDYNEIIVYEWQSNYVKALELLEAYMTTYGTDEKLDREHAFLKTRQGNSGS